MASKVRGSVVVLTLTVGALLRARAAAAATTVTKGPWVQRVTSNSAVVRLEVDPPSAVSVDLGSGSVEGDGGHRVVESSEERGLHAIVLSGLKPGTRYAYSVRVGASSKLGAFVTAPRDEGDVPFRFLVYGDNRTDDAAHAAVVRAMVPVSSDFLVHTGDFVENGASRAQWQTFFDVESPLLNTRSIFACVGNHELTDGSGIEYARLFGPTEVPEGAGDASRARGAPVATRPEHLDGTFRWGNTRFFLINGMVSYKGSVDRAWLERALADADGEPNLKWRVVVVHHGPWSSGPHGGNARIHDAAIPALLAGHKVDLVISGHDHIYERGWADGMAYLVSGGGGAPVYKVKAPIPQSKRVDSVRHFVEMRVSGASMQLVATRSDGSTVERCSLSKDVVGWDCDAPPAGSARSPASSSEAVSGGATPTTRCSCDVVGAAAGAGGGLAGLVGIAVLGLRRRAKWSTS